MREQIDESIAVESTDSTLAHFLRGLLIFGNWHNHRTDMPTEVSESLALHDDYLIDELGSPNNAVSCCIDAYRSAAKLGGDFERYIVRRSIYFLLNRLFIKAVDGLEFLLHFQGLSSIKYGGRESPFVQRRINPKVLLLRTLIAVISGRPDEISFWQNSCADIVDTEFGMESILVLKAVTFR